MNFSLLRKATVGFASAGTAKSLGYGLYLTAVGLGARRFMQDHDGFDASPQAVRFRVLIPAHNEEALLGETLRALAAVDYPTDLVDVFVVADNCSDHTADVAREGGARVYERNAPDRPGKGPALRWLIAAMPPGNDDDVVVILDADSIVESEFFSALSTRFESGAHVVQSYYAVRDDNSGGEVGFRSAAFAVRHFVRPAGRVQLGGSSSLYGNGMAFTEKVIRNFAWSSHLTEDLDMGLRLLLAGAQVDFEPLAVVRGEMPETQANAVSQHQRWEAGRREVARTYVPRLLTAAQRGSHGRRWAYLDAAIDIAMPPLGTLVATNGASTALLALFGRGPSRLVGVTGGSVGIFLTLAHVLASMRLAGAPDSAYRSLVRAPQNVVWKLQILRQTRSDAPTEWVRTARNDEPADDRRIDSNRFHDVAASRVEVSA